MTAFVPQSEPPQMVASIAEPGGKAPALRRNNSVVQAKNNSVVLTEKIQSFTGRNGHKPVGDDDDDWRFEIKRKRRDAGRKNTGSTAKKDWYYWVIRIRLSDGAIEYYGTLDILDEAHPERLQKYWKRSAKRKVGKNARSGR